MKANYLISGVWSKAAAKEASKLCQVNIVEDSESVSYARVNSDSWNVSADADFFHYIDNETGDGMEIFELPFDKIPASQPIVCDMSSSLLTKPIDWGHMGVVYAGA